MAAYYFGINAGAGVMGSVSEGSSTTSKDVEIVIPDTTKVTTKLELLASVEKLYAYLVTDSKNW